MGFKKQVTIILISLLFSLNVFAETKVRADILLLNNTTIPSTCASGEIRRNSSGVLQHCVSSAFTPLPSTVESISFTSSTKTPANAASNFYNMTATNVLYPVIVVGILFFP